MRRGTGRLPWTPPVSVVYALDAALDLYESTGEPNVWARHARYPAAIRAGAEALSIRTLSQPGAHSPTVVALRVPEETDGPAVARALREEHGVVIGGGQQELKGKIWRIGTMGNISQTDVLGAMGALEMVLRRLGHSARRGTGVRATLEVFENYALVRPATGRGDPPLHVLKGPRSGTKARSACRRCTRA